MDLIRVGAERASIREAGLQYVGASWGWAGLWPHGDARIEIRVDGHPQAPDPDLVALAEVVLPNLDALETVSDAYLRSFVACPEDLYAGTWRIQSVEIGWGYPSRRERGTRFDVTLAIRGDEYGQWRVGFKRDSQPGDVLHPCFFARKQW